MLPFSHDYKPPERETNRAQLNYSDGLLVGGVRIARIIPMHS
jgi:hypothetical protein